MKFTFLSNKSLGWRYFTVKLSIVGKKFPITFLFFCLIFSHPVCRTNFYGDTTSFFRLVYARNDGKKIVFECIYQVKTETTLKLDWIIKLRCEKNMQHVGNFFGCVCRRITKSFHPVCCYFVDRLEKYIFLLTKH